MEQQQPRQWVVSKSTKKDLVKVFHFEKRLKGMMNNDCSQLFERMRKSFKKVSRLPA